MTKLAAGSASSAAATAGKRPLRLRSLRERRLRFASPLKARQRLASSLRSQIQSGWDRRSSVTAASIGSMASVEAEAFEWPHQLALLEGEVLEQAVAELVHRRVH